MASLLSPALKRGCGTEEGEAVSSGKQAAQEASFASFASQGLGVFRPREPATVPVGFAKVCQENKVFYSAVTFAFGV